MSQEIKTTRPVGRITFPSIEHGKTSTGNRDWRTNSKWYIQEKLDGSQFSFSAHVDDKGERYMIYTCGNAERTRAAATFRKAIDVLEKYKSRLTVNWVYHSEMITSKRHNIVVYDRMPRNFVVVYDISTDQPYTDIDEIEKECTRVGLEWVPALYKNTDPDVNPHDMCKSIVTKIDQFEVESMLGGAPEGVVLKCPGYIDRDRKINAKVKYVTPKFEEVRHIKKPAQSKQTPTEFITWVGAHFDLPARFAKARQHLAQDDVQDDDAEYRELLEKELDRDLIKEQIDMIHSFITNEYPTWVNPKNETSFSGDAIYTEIMEYGSRHGGLLKINPVQICDELILPHVLKAARASL